MNRLRALVDVVMRTFTSWRQDRTIRQGAGVAYYGLFAIIPLLAITAALAEILFGTVDMEAYFQQRLSEVGLEPSDEASAAFTEELNDASTQSSLGAVGLVSLLFASSLLFVALSDAIQAIWRAPVETGVLESLRRRLLGFVMVLLTAAVLIGGFAVSAVSGAAEALIPGDVVVLERLADLLTGAVSGVLLASTIALLFRYVSPVTVPWRIAILSALVTSGVMYVGTAVVGWFMARFGGTSVTGAFGAVIAVLTWIYFEAQILLAGVQLSKVMTQDALGDNAAALDPSSETAGGVIPTQAPTPVQNLTEDVTKT